MDAWQWKPDLIWFNNLSLVKTPNYYVQQLYGKYSGSHVLSLTEKGNPVIGQLGLYASATIEKKSNSIILKIVNTGIINKKIKLNLKGVRSGEYSCVVTELSSSNLNLVNTLESPANLIPQEKQQKITLPEVVINIPACSFSVYSISI